MSASGIVGMVGIVVLVLCVGGVVAVWRTGSPFPPGRAEGSGPPGCVACGHGAYSHGSRGACGETDYDGPDRYDGGGNWVGTWGERPCPCPGFRTE
ncbi:hypothetical protein GCM10009738_86870 [Kitasatospora viridis]|uniref:Uncharacterized protein n=1 Tax=Kitasatospora viridis TaxID=281105 RepID=A0A561S9N7_9ACTN|nr:hypothetical protein FHX73_19218 [Kitasatospora viridis]